METITPKQILEHTEKFTSDTETSFENDFPVSAFPKPVQEFILAANEYLIFPVDFLGASMLFAASVAIGNTHKVNVMNNWNEGTILYIALVGRPGSNKTHPLKSAINPILTADKKEYLQYKQFRKDYEKSIRDVNPEHEPPQKPIFKKKIVSDFTPEALAELHSFNLRGLGVYSDELYQWIKNFNRYSSGSATEFWLSVFSGTQIIIDRKGQEPILISEPSISVCGGIQPSILNELQKDNKGQNGFIDRLLFAFPDNLQKEIWSETEIPQAYIEKWELIINNLLNLNLNFENGELKPTILDFSIFAKDILRAWQQKNTELINDTVSASLAGIYNKLEIYVIRFALIIELLTKATEKPLFNDEVEKITWFFRQAAKLCHPDRNPQNDGETMKHLNDVYEKRDLEEVERIYNQP